MTSLVFQILVLAFFTALVCSDNAVFGKNARLEWLLIFLAAVQSGPQVTMVSFLDSSADPSQQTLTPSYPLQCSLLPLLVSSPIQTFLRSVERLIEINV